MNGVPGATKSPEFSRVSGGQPPKSERLSHGPKDLRTGSGASNQNRTPQALSSGPAIGALQGILSRISETTWDRSQRLRSHEPRQKARTRRSFCRSNVVQDTNSGNRTLSDLFAANQLVNRFRSCLSCFDACELRPPLALHPGFRQWPRLPKQRCVHGILDECGTSKIRIRTALLLNQLP